MKLNIVTPLTRPGNLPVMRASIQRVLGKGVDIHWQVDYDRSHVSGCHLADAIVNIEAHRQPYVTGIAGHAHRNTFLMQIELHARVCDPLVLDDWIMSLDDDNILHPDLIPWMVAHKDELSGYSGLLFDQVHKDGSTRLQVHPDSVLVNHVDTAQFMFRGSIVNGLRFDESRYDADGVFIQELYSRNKEKFLIVNQPLCYYNYLR